jgi:phosphoribosylformylglycinamidine cyclo-ligase
MGEGDLQAGLALRRAYAAAGVDVAAGERAVELIRGAVASTERAEVLGGIGGFAAATRLPAGLADPVLVSATDGVGTKTAIASAVGRFDTIGIDLVAMCADDVVCTGAEPLLFLDYVAVGRLVPEQVAELVGSVAAGCREAGCALVGGETAEHPGLMPEDAFDLAGFCVGVVDRVRLLDGSAVRAGDAVVGIASSGLHANGFSLVRSLVAEHDIDLAEPYQARLLRSLGEPEAGEAIEAEPEHALATVGEVLLTPTRIYARPVLHARRALETRGLDLHGAAHVTGGGLHGNLPRMAGDGLAIRVDPARWRMPSVFRLVAALGGLDGTEVRATLNAGIGMALAVPPDGVETAIRSLAGDGLAAWVIGDVVEATSLGGRRYAEEAVRWLG